MSAHLEKKAKLEKPANYYKSPDDWFAPKPKSAPSRSTNNRTRRRRRGVANDRGVIPAIAMMRKGRKAAGDAVRHCGSVARALFMVVHSDFELDACLRDRKFAGQRCNQSRSGLKRIHYFFAPSAVFRIPLAGQPDLNRIAALFLADAGEQPRVARFA